MPSVPAVITITSAGIAAAYDASVHSVVVHITHVAFGTGASNDGYTPTGTETALHHEVKRVAVAGWVPMGGGSHKILSEVIAADVGNEFVCREIGFFLEDGTLFAVWSRGAGNIIAYVSSTVSLTNSHTLKLSGIPDGSVSVTVDPTASATLALLADHETDPAAHSYLFGLIFIAPSSPLTLSAIWPYVVDSIAAERTLILPAPTPAVARPIVIYRRGSNTVTVTRADPSHTIEGVADDFVLNRNFQVAVFAASSTTNYQLVNRRK